MSRETCFADILKSDPVPRFDRVLLPLSFALKWFCPFGRALIFPFLVTFNRFVYDLFVFIIAFLRLRLMFQFQSLIQLQELFVQETFSLLLELFYQAQ